MAPAAPLIDTSLVVGGVPGIALQGERLRVTVFPAAGGKILDLVHRTTGRDLLWKNPRVPLRATYPGPAFDDVWAGGWDELFPTDAPCLVDGNAIPDHGDLWSGPWDWSVSDDGEVATVHMRRLSVALPCLMERSLTLRRDGLDLEFSYRLTNLGLRPVPYVWSLHVAHPIAAGSRIHLPADRLGVAFPEQSRFGADAGDVAWPMHHGDDLSVALGPEAGLTEFLFTRDGADGWCAVTHPHLDLGLGLRFDSDVFRTTWTWGVYGGWRGHHVLLTEPSTSAPGSLAESIRRGDAATLAPGAVLETSVLASVLERPWLDAPGDVWPSSLLRA